MYNVKMYNTFIIFLHTSHKLLLLNLQIVQPEAMVVIMARDGLPFLDAALWLISGGCALS